MFYEKVDIHLDMISERQLLVFMVEVFEDIERPRDAINAMKKVIQINPLLNQEEKMLLEEIYKNYFHSLRNTLRIINLNIEKDTNSLHLEYLEQYKNKILNELEHLINELIGLIDLFLLTAISDAESIVFYEKMKADSYRYLVEFIPKDEKTELICKIKQCYEKAVDISKKEVSIKNKLYHKLFYNYTVFMYEILGKKIEAIKLASDVYNECSNALDEKDEEYGCIQADLTLLRIKDNIICWKDDIDDD